METPQFTLLKLPEGQCILQNRVEMACETLIPELTPAQMDQLLEAIYYRLIAQANFKEEVEEDVTFEMNAANRIMEARTWIFQLTD